MIAYIIFGSLFIICLTLANTIGGEHFIWGAVQFGGILFMYTLGNIIFRLADSGSRKRGKEIIEKGTHVTGLIVEHRKDDSFHINGNRWLNLIVNANVNGVDDVFIARIHDLDFSKYPIGKFVDIAVLGKEAEVIPGTVKESEEYL